MPFRRRTLTSPAVVAELRQKLYADKHQPNPPYGDQIKRIEHIIDIVFLYLWLTVIGIIPLILIAFIVGLGNFTVEWLYAAGIVFFGMLIYIASLSGLYGANQLAAGDKRGIKGIIGSLSAIISIVFLGWVVGVPKANPPSSTDVKLALFCGFWFTAWLIGMAIDDAITNAEEPRGARIASLISALVYSIWIILQAYSFAFDWSSRPEMRFWLNVQSSLSFLVFITSFITISIRQRVRNNKQPAR